MKRQNKF